MATIKAIICSKVDSHGLSIAPQAVTLGIVLLQLSIRRTKWACLTGRWMEERSTVNMKAMETTSAS